MAALTILDGGTSQGLAAWGKWQIHLGGWTLIRQSGPHRSDWANHCWSDELVGLGPNEECGGASGGLTVQEAEKLGGVLPAGPQAGASL